MGGDEEEAEGKDSMCAVLCSCRLAVVSFQVRVPLALPYKLSEICTNPIRIRESLEWERAAPTEAPGVSQVWTGSILGRRIL